MNDCDHPTWYMRGSEIRCGQCKRLIGPEDAYGKPELERLVQAAFFIRAEQHASMRALSKRLRRPMAQLVREGIDLVLARYADNGGNTP